MSFSDRARTQPCLPSRAHCRSFVVNQVRAQMYSSHLRSLLRVSYPMTTALPSDLTLSVCDCASAAQLISPSTWKTV